MTNQKFTQVELEMMVDQLREMLPAQLQMQTIQAQILYRRFVELQQAGFTEKQALELVKARPLFEG